MGGAITDTVLIIEDEPDLAGLLRDILESAGYVPVVTTGGQAAARVRDTRPAAIVMDYRMPGLNGAEVLQLLREDDENLAAAVILVTGLPNIADLAVELRADAYLRKPFDLDAFLAVVDRLVRGTES